MKNLNVRPGQTRSACLVDYSFKDARQSCRGNPFILAATVIAGAGGGCVRRRVSLQCRALSGNTSDASDTVCACRPGRNSTQDRTECRRLYNVSSSAVLLFLPAIAAR